MKSERMKRGGVGWGEGEGEGGKGSEIVLGFWGRRRRRRRSLESVMENSVLFGCFCLSPGVNNKSRSEET